MDRKTGSVSKSFATALGLCLSLTCSSGVFAAEQAQPYTPKIPVVTKQQQKKLDTKAVVEIPDELKDVPLETILEQVKSDDMLTSRGAMRSIGIRAVENPALRKQMTEVMIAHGATDKDSGVRDLAAYWLGRTGEIDAILAPAIALALKDKFLNDADYGIRAQAVSSLAMLADSFTHVHPMVLPILKDKLRDPEPEIRKAALRGLGYLAFEHKNYAREVFDLLESLTKTEPDTRTRNSCEEIVALLADTYKFKRSETIAKTANLQI